MKCFGFSKQIVAHKRRIMVKERLNKILLNDNIGQSLNDNIDFVISIIPEIKHIIGFEHNHPHHNLNVWDHTIKALEYSKPDLEIRIALLLHDIGKPFSYQDEEVRHFHGHPLVSSQISYKILRRLAYDEGAIKRIIYLIENHDNKIDIKNLHGDLDLVCKLLHIQYADTYAHNPDKIKKRLELLGSIEKELKQMIKKDEETRGIFCE